MKKFFLYFFLFIIPIILFLGALEFTVHQIPNSYSFKYNYVRTNGSTIKALALGHSQFYDDFKPDEFYLPAFNLSNSAQGYMDDYYLLKELLPYMPNLKVVLIPIGYMSVGREEQFAQNSCFYYEYMNIDYDGQIPLRYRRECFDVKGSVKKIGLYYILNGDIVKCDSLGWSPKRIEDRKSPLGSDSVMDIYTLDEDAPLYLAGEKYLYSIIELLNQNDIHLVLVSPPYYWKLYDRINYKQLEWETAYINMLLKEKPQVSFINMETGDVFEDRDFFDESHLTESGAETFTKKLSDEVRLLIDSEEVIYED